MRYGLGAGRSNRFNGSEIDMVSLTIRLIEAGLYIRCSFLTPEISSNKWVNGTLNMCFNLPKGR